VRALDTNVLVRALVRDAAAPGRRAQACLSAQQVYIPVTVILELEWVLRTRYGYSPKAIGDAMIRQFPR
jgi:predicted nucleic-acid-binding protein